MIRRRRLPLRSALALIALAIGAAARANDAAATHESPPPEKHDAPATAPAVTLPAVNPAAAKHEAAPETAPLEKSLAEKFVEPLPESKSKTPAPAAAAP